MPTISPTTARPYHYTHIIDYHNQQPQQQQEQQHQQRDHTFSISTPSRSAMARLNGLDNLPPFRLLQLTLPLVMIVSIIELSFVSAMVGFLHGRANGVFVLTSPGHNNSSPAGANTLELHGKPRVLLENQGHTSNGAAGTAFVLIGCGGLLLVWWEQRRLRLHSRAHSHLQHERSSSGSSDSKTTTTTTSPSMLFTIYTVMTLLSTLLALAALIYTFVVTQNHGNQVISLDVVSQNQAPTPYPDQQWTPENWFGAVLDQLPLAVESDRSKLRDELKIMRGWRWNLIPLFLVDVLIMLVAAWEWWRLRRGGGGMGLALGKNEANEGRERESL